MRTFSAIAGSAAFFIVAPGVVAGLVPWLLTDRWSLPWSRLPGLGPIGGLLIVAAIAVLLHAFARFALEGLGTPAPVAPTTATLNPMVRLRKRGILAFVVVHLRCRPVVYKPKPRRTAPCRSESRFGGAP